MNTVYNLQITENALRYKKIEKPAKRLLLIPLNR